MALKPKPAPLPPEPFSTPNRPAPSENPCPEFAKLLSNRVWTNSQFGGYYHPGRKKSLPEQQAHQHPMPQKCRDRSYGRRKFGGSIGLLLLLILIARLVELLAGEPRKLTAGAIVVGTIGFGVLVIGTTWLIRLRSRYRCPQCGAHLPPLEPEAVTGHEHCFLCERCDILWLTGVYEGEWH